MGILMGRALHPLIGGVKVFGELLLANIMNEMGVQSLPSWEGLNFSVSFFCLLVIFFCQYPLSSFQADIVDAYRKQRFFSDFIM